MRQAKRLWRLKKTLARDVEFRPIEKEDMPYIWAAYKKGALASMAGVFAELAMTADEFKIAFEVELTTVYHAAWTLLAGTKKGHIPVGLVLGFWSHPDPRFAVFMTVGDLIWYPWASPRNKVESAVNFFNGVRTQIKMMHYTDSKSKAFFEMIAKHGVMRRVGTSYNVYPNQPTSVFETRA